MEYNLMMEFLKHQTRLIHSGFLIYEEDELINKSFPDSYNAENLIRNNVSLKKLVQSTQPLNFYIEDELFAVGAVKNLNTPYTIIIGPFRTGENLDSASKAVYRRHPNTFGSIEETKDVIKGLPSLSLSMLFNLLSTVFFAINQEPASLNSLSLGTEITTLSDSVNKSMTETPIESDQRTYSIEYEKQLIFAIKNGLVDRIDALEQDSEIGKVGISSPNNLP